MMMMMTYATIKCVADENCYYDDDDDHEGSNGEMLEMRSRMGEADTGTPESLSELQTDSVGSAKSMDDQGLIYFLETEDRQFIKIGFSTQWTIRLSQLGPLRPGNFALKVLGSIPGSIAIERWLHKRFAEERDNGEWFKRSSRLSAFIDSIGMVPPVVMKEKKPRKPRNIVRPLYIQPETELEPVEESIAEETVGMAK